MVDQQLEHPPAPTPREETLFTVLANQARGHSVLELATTAVGGGIDAFFIAQRTGLWWLAAAFIAVSAYGTWGLLDAWRESLSSGSDEESGATAALGAARALSASAGVLAAIAAVGGFMGAALGGWIL